MSFKQTIRKTVPALALAAAIASVGALQVGDAQAYFCANTFASGSSKVTLGYSTEVHDRVEANIKTVTLKNTGKVPVYARVQIFAPAQIGAEPAGENWTQEGDYWYYDELLPVDGESAPLNITVTKPEAYEKSFNVVVVQECTPAVYDAQGTTSRQTADWSLTGVTENAEEGEQS